MTIYVRNGNLYNTKAVKNRGFLLSISGLLTCTQCVLNRSNEPRSCQHPCEGSRPSVTSRARSAGSFVFAAGSPVAGAGLGETSTHIPHTQPHAHTRSHAHTGTHIYTPRHTHMFAYAQMHIKCTHPHTCDLVNPLACKHCRRLQEINAGAT